MKPKKTKSKRATKILLIRHAEKPAKDSAPYGVTREGERSKESLEIRGWQRAGALANLLAPPNGRLQHPSLAQPQFLYASKPLRRKGSKRPIETITPLAEKLEIRINSQYERSDLEGVLEEVFSCRGPVLMCWQREYIPKIASYILGTDKGVPRLWLEDRFALIWVFDLNLRSDSYKFRQVPQRLLMGDWTTPIK